MKSRRCHILTSHCAFGLLFLVLANLVFGDSIDSHVEQLSSKDPFIRVDAVHALRDLGKAAESAIPELIKLFPDHRIGIRGANLLPVPRENVSVSGEASRAIWVIGEGAISHLIACLEDSDHESQVVAAKTLGLFEGKAADAADVLLKQCENENADVRRECLAALVSIGQQRANVLDKVLAMHNGEPDADVRYVLVQAMERFGGDDIRTVRPLSAFLRDESPEVRGYAARTLARHGKHAEAVVSALVERLSDEGMRSEWLAPDVAHQIPVKEDVIESLVVLLRRAPRQAEKVANVMSGKRTPNERANAALVLVKSRTMQAEAKSVVCEILEHNDGGIEASLLVLSELGADAKPVVSLIDKFSQHENERIRHQSIETLGHVGGNQAIDSLKELMQHHDVITRSFAADALSEIGPDAHAARPLLETALVDTSEPRSFILRRAAARALGRLGVAATASIPKLQHVTEDVTEDSGIRAAAALALGDISPRDRSVQKTLRAILSDKECDDEVRTAAATAFGKAGTDVSAEIPLFLSVLTEPYVQDDLRAAAARSLGHIGEKTESTVEALVKVLREEPGWLNYDSRREAAWALGQLQSTEALQLLKKVSASEDDDELVRKAASEAVIHVEKGIQ